MAVGNQFHLATLLAAVLMTGFLLHLNLDVTYSQVHRNQAPNRSVGWPFAVDTRSYDDRNPNILRWNHVRRKQVLNLIVAVMGIALTIIAIEVYSRHGFRGACRRILIWKWAHRNTKVLASIFVIAMLSANCWPWVFHYPGTDFLIFGWPYNAVRVWISESEPFSVSSNLDQDFLGNIIIFAFGFLITIYMSERLSARFRPRAFWVMTIIGLLLFVANLLLVFQIPPVRKYSGDGDRIPEWGRQLLQPPQCFNLLIIAAIAIAVGALYEYYLRRRDRLLMKNS